MSVPEVWPPPLTFRELLALGREEIERLDEQAWTSLDNMKDVWLRAPADREPVPFEDSLGFSQLTWPFLTSAAAALRRSADRTPTPARADLRIARSVDPVSDDGKALREAFDECRFSLHSAIFERDGDDRPISAVTQAFRKRRTQWELDVALLLVRAIGIWTELLANIDRDFDSKCSLVYAVLPDIYDFPKEYLGVGWNREMLAHLASIAGLTDVAEKIASDLPLVSARDCRPLVDILTVSDLDDADVLQLGRSYLAIPGNQLMESPWELRRPPDEADIQHEFKIEDGSLAPESETDRSTKLRVIKAIELSGGDIIPSEHRIDDAELLCRFLANVAIRQGDLELALRFFPDDYAEPQFDTPETGAYFVPLETDREENLVLLGYIRGRLDEKRNRGDEISFKTLQHLADLRRLTEETNLLVRHQREQGEADSGRLRDIHNDVQEIYVTLPEAITRAFRGSFDEALAEKSWEKAKDELLRRVPADAINERLSQRHGQLWGALNRETREDLIAVEWGKAAELPGLAPLVALGICRAFERELGARLTRLGETEFAGLGDMLARSGSVPALREIASLATEHDVVAIRNGAAHSKPVSPEDLERLYTAILRPNVGLLWRVL